MTRSISIQELPRSTRELLASLGEDDEIIVSDGNKPVAKISTPPPPCSVPPPAELDLSFDPSKPREFGFLAGKVWIAPDFDDPLPDSFWLGEDQ
ncbi:MAG: hypothetical protein FWD53_01700 [Phycisphaerales bacterium]|nr:hypothetical protein [Phycisphaerales bacterium]